jgi:hypothetical protein
MRVGNVQFEVCGQDTILEWYDGLDETAIAKTIQKTLALRKGVTGISAPRVVAVKLVGVPDEGKSGKVTDAQGLQ